VSQPAHAYLGSNHNEKLHECLQTLLLGLDLLILALMRPTQGIQEIAASAGGN